MRTYPGSMGPAILGLFRAPALRYMLALASLLTAVSCVAQTEPPASNGTAVLIPGDNFAINYTGALFGYYREEPEERTIVGKPMNPVPEAVKAFPKANDSQRSPVLLGLGDNFAPEFGASIEGEINGTPNDRCYLAANPNRPKHRFTAPEVLYKDENRLPPAAGCDNVGRFLMEAGYSAIVPGKEDFLYSARWLRRMALLFQTASAHGEEPSAIPEIDTRYTPTLRSVLQTPPRVANITSPNGRLYMLAANLRLDFKVEGPSLRPGDISSSKLGKAVKSICPLLFSWDPLGSDPNRTPQTCIAGGGDQGINVTEEMDWLHRIDTTFNPQKANPQSTYLEKSPLDSDDFTGEDSDVATAINVQARLNPGFRAQLLANQAEILLNSIDPRPCDLDQKSAEVIWEKNLKQYLELLKNSAPGGMIGHDKDLSTLTSPSDPFYPNDQLRETKQTFTAIFNSEQPNVPEPSRLFSPACRSYIDDLHAVAKDLYTRVDAWKSTQPGRSYLSGYAARKAEERLLLRRIAYEQEHVGYTVAQGPGTDNNTLVIGVIGQETMKAVSPANMQICTRHLALDAKLDSNELAPCDPDKTYQDPSPSGPARLVAKVNVGDPVLAITTLIRAAWVVRKDAPGKDFNRVVVLAQMPKIEAEELAAQVRADLDRICGKGPNRPYIDLILSEAQPNHRSPTMTLKYDRKDIIPVLTPRPAWYTNYAKHILVKPVSSATLQSPGAREERVLHNTLPEEEFQVASDETPRQDGAAVHLERMAEMLHDQLVNIRVPKSNDPSFKALWDGCKHKYACENSVLMQYLLEEIHRSSNADVVLLERRDFYFGELVPGYETYDVCTIWTADNKAASVNPPNIDDHQYCKLRTALDRVLWKGDYSERVMVDGKSLKQMIATAQQEANDEQSLAARDTTQEWLMTYGVVSKPPTNLTATAMGAETFSVPGLKFCTDKNPGGGSAVYCINGQEIADDGAYWVATSDSLANDSQLYKVLQAQNASYHMLKKELYFNGEIGDEAAKHDQPHVLSDKNQQINPQTSVALVEQAQQMRSIWQVDFTKLVGGFMLRKPDLPNTQLSNNFSGVSDSRATTPSAQEFDFEAATRVTAGSTDGTNWQRLTYGVQSDSEYDRAVAGNINGNPETVTYALNSFTVGGFVQWHLNSGISNRWHIVLAPYQYQRQITGNYLNFKYASGTGQINVPTPAATGFSQRVGVRFEFGGGKGIVPDPGSYFEVGPEYSNQNDQLSALILPNGKQCPASDVAFSTCVAANIMVTPSTKITPLTETLHTGGAYWDVHLQKALDEAKHYSATIETKGDEFFLPGVTLPTQTRHAFTTTGVLNFAIIGNLSLAPTFTTFFYRNQGPVGISHDLVTNTFSITARWYFARDAAVPASRQFLFIGPASKDQTKTSRMK